jgi:hypothetical protein
MKRDVIWRDVVMRDVVMRDVIKRDVLMRHYSRFSLIPHPSSLIP